jgi:UDP-N-acetylglucosamine 2-epimerase (non-hydrolysing)
MNLVCGARLVVTDSGGVQEETTYLGIPCLTLRPNTERPITIIEGSNRLVTAANLAETVDEILADHGAHGRKPELWDGHTAQRVVADIRRRLLDAAPARAQDDPMSNTGERQAANA